MKRKHPLEKFKFCPICGSKNFMINNFKSKKCADCGFTYYFNPSAAVACFIKSKNGDLLLALRAKDPAANTLDLPGGFVDLEESAEQALRREIKEETSLELKNIKFLFSIPNHYLYSGLMVDTIDLFFEAEAIVNEENIDDSKVFGNISAHDDVKSLRVMKIKDLNADDFGLESIRKAIFRYKKYNK